MVVLTTRPRHTGRIAWPCRGLEEAGRPENQRVGTISTPAPQQKAELLEFCFAGAEFREGVLFRAFSDSRMAAEVDKRSDDMEAATTMWQHSLSFPLSACP